MAENKRNLDSQFVRGLPFGLIVGLMFAWAGDNWAYVVIGIALAPAFGSWGSEGNSSDDGTTDQDDGRA